MVRPAGTTQIAVPPPPSRSSLIPAPPRMFTSPPATGEVCAKTNAAHRLMQRPDDNEATVAKRLQVYEEQTKPLVEYYGARGLLRKVDAEAELDEVTRRVLAALS